MSDTKKMIEVLKEKKLNSKKVAGVIQDIQKYASLTSVEKPSFESENIQREYVKSQVQSAIDLLNRRARLKVIIDQTNINTKLRIPKGIVTPEHELTIAEALMFKMNYREYQLVYGAMNKNLAETKLRSTTSADGTKVVAIQLYDEEFKNNSLKDLQTKLDYIDAHLEMINATTDVTVE